MKKLVLLFAIAMFFSSCSAGMKQATTYDPKSLSRIAMADDTYRIFEHPDRQRIMVTTSLSRAAGQGFVSGLTFGVVPVRTPEQQFEAAARAHLDRTERSQCKITRGYLLVRKQYEFQFDCSGELA